MELILDIQLACDASAVPARERLEAWLSAALARVCDVSGQATELTLRIVDEVEGAELNRRYRGRRGATNVLSFPFELPPGLDPDAARQLPTLLGDLVLCAPVVAREAAEQRKPPHAHWAHLVVHGLLHLLGHDHNEAAEAIRMEALETAILRGLGFPPPYEAAQDPHDERPI